MKGSANKTKLDKIINGILWVVIVLACLSFLYNVVSKPLGWECPSFICINIAQFLTIGVAVMIAFWAVQSKNDQRKKKEHAEDVLLKIQAIVNKDIFVKIDSTDKQDEVTKETSVTNRKLSNCLLIIKEYAKEFGFEEDANYLEEEFRGYKDFISEHLGNISYLADSEVTLRRYAENIDSKCDMIIYQLYK